MCRKFFLTALLFVTVAGSGWLHAQDDLIKKISGNSSDSTGFRFTNIINLEVTPIENQGSSGTCWSYSTNSFLESEMIKAGRKPVPLAKIYTARRSYEDKAENYVKMNGAVSWGDGGEAHDVINMYAKYGAVPEEVYTGLLNGATTNNFSEMQAILKAMLDAVIKNPAGVLSPRWKKAFAATLDAYLGPVPPMFTYQNKSYTPQSFAKEVVGLDAGNYIEFISQNNTPYWQKAMMMVPDNWAFQWDYNIPPAAVTDIIDNALKNGYTVAWGTDVSEPYFSWPNGVAFVPQNPFSYVKNITAAQKKELFTSPKPEPEITPELRQTGIENGQTSDDHGMHIVGLSKDQDGKEYYIVKNSWGTGNEYKGYLHVTKAYVQFKTTSILVNKKAVPKSVASKITL
ncbi:C1 family peptidase [Niabella drilacis]|uniref:Aminopeptidase n=1 Tax=Niabella drilacis (strain DSM 25811 / CCM 8410 / CCUG 62505 / LMG 26954 / E90) TaxID=1285928 RepID=A0A1G6WCC1_NIADE|nr:C1 family peptidase [Niabella drilacis]SDD63439.1 bleomycin hydrolase [Niabella drilacis]